MAKPSYTPEDLYAGGKMARKPGSAGAYRGRPYVVRRILWMYADGTTSRGRVERYTEIYECGHSRGQSHSPRAFVAHVAWRFAEEQGQELGLVAYCWDCGKDAPLDYFDKRVLGRLPVKAVMRHPELKEAWDRVKDIPVPERLRDIFEPDNDSETVK
jgi:hypothetical protein